MVVFHGDSKLLPAQLGWIEEELAQLLALSFHPNRSSYPCANPSEPSKFEPDFRRCPFYCDWWHWGICLATACWPYPSQQPWICWGSQAALRWSWPSTWPSEDSLRAHVAILQQQGILSLDFRLRCLWSNHRAIFQLLVLRLMIEFFHLLGGGAAILEPHRPGEVKLGFFRLWPLKILQPMVESVEKSP